VAKEQKRGNREARKPKQAVKTPPQAVSPFAVQGKLASTTKVPAGKGKA